MHLPHTKCFIEQNPVSGLSSDKSNMLQNDLKTSYDNSELDEYVSDDDSFCNDYDDLSSLFDKELNQFVNSGDENLNLILKIKIMNQGLQKFNPSATCLKYLIFLPMLLGITLLPQTL